MRNPWIWFGILAVMIAGIVALLIGSQSQFEQQLNALAQARDVAGLTSKASPTAWQGRNPFAVFKTNSAYETGKFGWEAKVGASPWGQSYVVFTTPLTSEDVGERLFETDGSKLTRFVQETEDFGWRIERHTLQVAFDVPAKKVAIDDAIVVRSTGTGQNLILRMSPNYSVTEIRRNGSRPAKWTQLGGNVMIGGVRDGDTLHLKYTGLVDKPGYAGSIQKDEALLTNDYWYPMIARKPSRFSISVVGPNDWTVVTHGEQVSTQVQGNQRTTKYEMSVPISYWSLNAGKYKTVQETIGGRIYKCWSMTLDDEKMNLQPKFFPLIIDTMEAFGKFPFSGYGSCVTPAYGGGALEGYSFVTSGYYSGEDSHEVGHTWFGGLVNNTYLRSLWNESFAVWSSGYYRRNAELGNRAERELAYIDTPQIDESAFHSAPVADAPAEIGPAATSLGYGKGGYVLQMLEHEIGTKLFVDATKRWIATADKTRGGEWEDFEKVVNQVAGRDLTWFFDQWIRRTGWADFEIRDVAHTGGEVRGVVKFKGPEYRIKCDVLLETAAGPTLTRVDLRSGTFRIPVTGRPSLISFDPWRRILRKIGDDERPTEISSALEDFPRVDVRPSAGYLHGVGKPSNGSLSNPAGKFVVGLPGDDPILANLYSRAGISIVGNQATYQGTSIDLRRGGVVAVIELADGTQCAVGAGKISHPPDFGRARLMLFDELGRFIRGKTDPKRKGALTFRLN